MSQNAIAMLIRKRAIEQEKEKGKDLLPEHIHEARTLYSP
jgi:hypothetical protein